MQLYARPIFRAKVVNLAANTTPEKRKIHRAEDSRRRVSDFQEVLKSGHRVTAMKDMKIRK